MSRTTTAPHPARPARATPAEARATRCGTLASLTERPGPTRPADPNRTAAGEGA